MAVLSWWSDLSGKNNRNLPEIGEPCVSPVCLFVCFALAVQNKHNIVEGIYGYVI